MTQLSLVSFQPLSRVAQLHREGVLRGDWAHVPGGWDRAYRLMSARMTALGIECDGRPPMWAFPGRRTWGDAFGLLGEHDLEIGYAALTFTAPTELVLLTDYDEWCDALRSGRWAGDTIPLSRAAERGLQATLPRIELGWASHVTRLPRHGIFDLDWDTPT